MSLRIFSGTMSVIGREEEGTGVGGDGIDVAAWRMLGCTALHHVHVTDQVG